MFGPLIPNPRVLAAWHEAGHVVIGHLVFPGTIGGAWITNTGKGTTEIAKPRPHNSPHDFMRRMLCIVAGDVAEQLATHGDGVSPLCLTTYRDETGDGRHLRRNAEEWARLTGRAELVGVNHALTKTRRMLEDPTTWDMVARIADALIRLGSLDAVQILSILNEGEGVCQPAA
jgi:hypothetical protein